MAEGLIFLKSGKVILLLKLIGTVLILSSGLSFGLAVSQSYVKRMASIQSLLQALDIMEKEISYRMTPIPEILSVLAQNTSQPYSILFRNVCMGLKKDPTRNLSVQWQESLLEIQRPMNLSDDVCTVLRSFADVIGKYEVEEQRRTIFYISDRLKDYLLRAEKEKESKGKVYRTCSIATCILLVILLF